MNTLTTKVILLNPAWPSYKPQGKTLFELNFQFLLRNDYVLILTASFIAVMANKDPVIIERTKENNWKLTAAQLDETLVKVRYCLNLYILERSVKQLPQVGLEPTTFGLEVQRAIHCATGACGPSQFITIWIITEKNSREISNWNFMTHKIFRIQFHQNLFWFLPIRIIPLAVSTMKMNLRHSGKYHHWWRLRVNVYFSEVCRKHDLIVLSDEIYGICGFNNHKNISFSKVRPPSGIDKSFLSLPEKNLHIALIFRNCDFIIEIVFCARWETICLPDLFQSARWDV